MNNLLTFEYCDWQNPLHASTFLELLNHYMKDPMGDYAPLDKEQQNQLLGELANHPTSEVLLMKQGDIFAGMATTFINFSTFKIKPYLYIHDVVVLDTFRGQGLGKALIQELIRISKERGYCKLTLEVREDNPAAQRVYKSLGFDECETRMYFWEKRL